GKSHGNDYRVTDRDAACVENAKWQLAMLLLLLGDNADRARSILSSFTPLFASKEDYLSYMDAMSSEGDRILYREDGSAEVRIN
ncbi:MAG: hypothetical protein IJW62_00940, partial [Clostridia bacterium]|nr:hypothetical protein [Clostridia bacterium]